MTRPCGKQSLRQRLELDLGSRTYSKDFKRLAAPDRVRQAERDTALLVYGNIAPAWISLRPWYRDRGLRAQVTARRPPRPTPRRPSPRTSHERSRARTAARGRRERPAASSCSPRRAASASSTSRRPRCRTSSTASRSCSASTCTTTTSCTSPTTRCSPAGPSTRPRRATSPRARAGLDRAALRVLGVRRAARARHFGHRAEVDVRGGWLRGLRFAASAEESATCTSAL